MGKHRNKANRLFRPDGCVSPNEAGKQLSVTGEAVKQWIYNGRLKAAKDPKNGYWWIKQTDLDECLQNRNNLDFKFHNLKGKTTS